MNWKQILAIGVLALGLLGLWMHRYQYEQYGDNALVRVHRITGTTEYYLLGQGWTPSEGPEEETSTESQDTESMSPYQAARTRLELARREWKIDSLTALVDSLTRAN